MPTITINVGKRGITEGLIREINKALEKHGVVKVRMLRNFRKIVGKDRREIAREIARHVDGKLVDVRGFVLTFER
ncbi:MAG: RNA-binding protein [Archaeoglobales archaeon]|nr:MAG: RNA-binding protein [Archaeoglobales archaeon]